jgi:hypothetical protein
LPVCGEDAGTGCELLGSNNHIVTVSTLNVVVVVVVVIAVEW